MPDECTPDDPTDGGVISSAPPPNLAATAPIACTPDDPSDGAICESIPGDFAPVPAVPSPSGLIAPAHGLADLRARYGAIEVQAGAIVGPHGWESANMHICTDLPGWPRRLYLNNAIEAPLRLALQRCVDRLDGYTVRTLGCFNPRLKRVNGDLSVHSWGLAVDMNADKNPLAPVGGALVKDIPDEWIALWEAIGWTWGGRFRRPDPMHFQWCSAY